MTGPVDLITANMVIDLTLMVMLIVVVVAIAATRNLLSGILLLVIYSLVMATWLLVMDGADVSFTEAVVGAGISTIVLLGAILLTRSETKARSWVRMIVPLGLAAGTGAVLAYAAIDLPALGDPEAPANAHLGRHFLENTYYDVGIPNMVTAVLASYRGYDTLGEATVIFAASVGVAIMLGFGERAMTPGERNAMLTPMRDMAESDRHVVLRVAAKLFIPLILIFAFYVHFHGELSPGGGFQAGVIIGAAIILHALVFGLKGTMTAIRPGAARGVAALGVLVYGAVGVWNIINGGNFLEYDAMFTPETEAWIDRVLGHGDGSHNWGQHFGIIGIEIGVLLTVTAAMITIFYAFAGRALESEERAEAGKARDAA